MFLKLKEIPYILKMIYYHFKNFNLILNAKVKTNNTIASQTHIKNNNNKINFNKTKIKYLMNNFLI